MILPYYRGPFVVSLRFVLSVFVRARHRADNAVEWRVRHTMLYFISEVITPLIQQLVHYVHFHTKTYKVCFSGTYTCFPCAISYKTL
jgi:hypothetical protein